MIEVLAYIERTPRPHPKQASRELRMGLDNWYHAMERLEDLGLICSVRAAPDVRAAEYAITFQGRRVLQTIENLEQVLLPSFEGIRWRALNGTIQVGSLQAADIMIDRIREAAMNVDLRALRRLEEYAGAVNRLAEAWISIGMSYLLRHDVDRAVDAMNHAIGHLWRQQGEPAFRLACTLRASARLDHAAIETYRYAKSHDDPELKVLNKEVFALAKARLGQKADAIRILDRAVELSRSRRCGGLALGAPLTRSMLDIGHPDPMEPGRLHQALAKASARGVRLLQARIRGQLSLVYASGGNPLASEEQSKALAELLAPLGKPWTPTIEAWRDAARCMREARTPEERERVASVAITLVRPAPLYLGSALKEPQE